MTNFKKKLFLFTLTIGLFSCKEHKVVNDNIHNSKKIITGNFDSLRQLFDENIVYIGDSLLEGKKSLIKNYAARYQRDSCGIIVYQDSLLKSQFEGIKNMGDLNNDRSNDTVFVVPPFDYCDNGYSYVFFDTTLPRLETNSYCCHPENIFSIGDLDENGINEIGQYYSSCASHYKQLIIYSLKNNKWKEVGNCTYDLFYLDTGKPYSSFIKKLSKGKFAMLEITDLTNDTSKIGKPNWKQFSIQ